MKPIDPIPLFYWPLRTIWYPVGTAWNIFKTFFYSQHLPWRFYHFQKLLNFITSLPQHTHLLITFDWSDFVNIYNNCPKYNKFHENKTHVELVYVTYGHYNITRGLSLENENQSTWKSKPIVSCSLSSQNLTCSTLYEVIWKTAQPRDKSVQPRDS